jgi:hypothetical protein
MKILDVFYYYYYLFYSRILKDDEPHLLTTLALSASESFLIIYLIDTLGVYFFCKFLMTKLGMIGVAVTIPFINYLYYHRTERAIEIIRKEPKLFNNHEFSKYLTVIFFIVTVSFLFWMADYLLYVIDKCK